MMNNKTNEQLPSGFPPVPDDAPAPSEAVWEGIRRSLKRKDFWHVKGKLTVIAAAACITAVILLQLTGPATETMETPPAPQAVTENAMPEPVPTEKADAVLPAALPGQKPATVTQVSQPHTTAPTDHITPALPPPSEPVLEITETVAETPLPLPERPVPSAVRATEQPATAPAPSKTGPATTPSVSETTVQENAAPAPANVLVTFPSAFTPNGDGLNDTYRPVLSGEVSQYLLRIYNRKNQLVFQTTHPEEAWDGTFHGALQPHGAYVGTVVCTGTDGKKQSAKGEFLLLRD